MKIELQTKPISSIKTDLAAAGCFEGEKSLPGILQELDRKLKGAVRNVLKNHLNGKEGESFILHTRDRLAFSLLLLVGMGKQKDFTLSRLRKGVGAVIGGAKRFKAKRLSVSLESFLPADFGIENDHLIQTIAETAVLADFSFDKYKSDQDSRKKEILQLILSTAGVKGRNPFSSRPVHQGQMIASSANFVRILANEPSNVMTPKTLARAARQAVRGTGVRCTVRDEKWLRGRKMNAILGVAQGSRNAPQLVVLEYNPRGAKGAPIALVGKGVTFDTGGISIKPSEGMEQMKYDMCGAAAVFGAIQAAAKLGIRQRIVGIAPLVENMPGGSAQRPGDVIRTFSGKWVEVLNTDAEGRLILSDALAYAQKFKPRAIIDLATLTGACVVALGHEATGMMGTDERLKAKIREAGEKTGERVWELPLWEEYFEAIKSDVADIKNIGNRSGGGTITAAMFLKQFVGNTPWVHLDIAGTAWNEKGSHPYLGKGPTGVGVRLLVEAIRSW